MLKQGTMPISLGGPLPLAGGALVAYAAATTDWRVNMLAGLWLLALSLAFIIGVGLKSIREVWLGVIWMATANMAVALVEWYGFGFAGYGLAGNPNYFGCILAICLAAAIGYRQWWFVPIMLAGLVWCQSRGAMFAGGVACFVGFWWLTRVTGWIVLLAIIGALPWVKLDGGTSFIHRMGIWQDTLNHLTFFGSGWGSFQQAYGGFAVKTNSSLMIAPHAYNDALELVFTLGIGSALAWLVIALCFEGRNWPDRLICITFGALSLTYFPLWIVGPLFTLTLGHMSQTKDENPWLGGN